MSFFGCVVPRSCIIQGFPRLWSMRGELRLGERVKIRSTQIGYPIGSPFPRCIFSALPRASIEIGDDTAVILSALFASERITIGKRVLIAAGCRIADRNGHIVDSIPRNQWVPDESVPIAIEDDVWLCADVTVCKGVTIGKGSVIGTKSVVTRDIPPGVLAAGVPARVIRPLRLGDR